MVSALPKQTIQEIPLSPVLSTLYSDLFVASAGLHTLGIVLTWISVLLSRGLCLQGGLLQVSRVESAMGPSSGLTCLAVFCSGDCFKRGLDKLGCAWRRLTKAGRSWKDILAKDRNSFRAELSSDGPKCLVTLGDSAEGAGVKGGRLAP